MRLGIVSDTHGHVLNTLAAVRMLEELKVATILHCGDIGSPEIPPLFAQWPTHFVFGNTDYDRDDLREAIERAGLRCEGEFGDLTLGGRRIALLHGDDIRRFRAATDSGDYDLVCYGHTHRAEHHTKGRTLILNPGALYRADPHTIALVNTKTMEVTSVMI